MLEKIFMEQKRACSKNKQKEEIVERCCYGFRSALIFSKARGHLTPYHVRVGGREHNPSRAPETFGLGKFELVRVQREW